MDKIEVGILHESHECPAGMMMFLARLTQRGHSISNLEELVGLYNSSLHSHKTAAAVANLPHGTTKRATSITVAVVGASRRFLAQARTHQVGINFMSASLQYSDYSSKASFVVPYEIMEYDNANGTSIQKTFLNKCTEDLRLYEGMIEAMGLSNDTAGYVMNQALRNILVITANHEAWLNFIRTRSCRRNTNETQYVTLRIWEELLKTNDGEEMFAYAGPDCLYGVCREGKMTCGDPVTSGPSGIIEDGWPLL